MSARAILQKAARPVNTNRAPVVAAGYARFIGARIKGITGQGPVTWRFKAAAAEWKTMSGAAKQPYQDEAKAEKLRLSKLTAAPAPVFPATITFASEEDLEKLVAKVSAAAIGDFLREVASKGYGSEEAEVVHSGAGKLRIQPREGKRPITIHYRPNPAWSK